MCHIQCPFIIIWGDSQKRFLLQLLQLTILLSNSLHCTGFSYAHLETKCWNIFSQVPSSHHCSGLVLTFWARLGSPLTTTPWLSPSRSRLCPQTWSRPLLALWRFWIIPKRLLLTNLPVSVMPLSAEALLRSLNAIYCKKLLKRPSYPFEMCVLNVPIYSTAILPPIFSHYTYFIVTKQYCPHFYLSLCVIYAAIRSCFQISVHTN